MQEYGYPIVPVDLVTDCMDVFELVCNCKGLSNDKNQRLVIFSLREDRLRRKIRAVQHWPTGVMLADGLTKVGHFLQLLRFSTTGMVVVELQDDKFIRSRSRARCVEPYTEKDLEMMEW